MQIVTPQGRSVEGFRVRSTTCAVLAALVAVGIWSGSRAEAGFVVSGQSSGFAINSNLSIASLATATLNLNALSGSAPSPYSSSSTNNVGGAFSAGAYNLPVLGTPEVLLSGSTGLLQTNVSSTVLGTIDSGTTAASTRIDNLNLNVLATLLVPVVNVTATTLTTSSTVNGGYNALSGSGIPTTTGLSIMVLGINVTALVQASAGLLVDVSGLTGLTGLKIGINLVSVTGNGVTTRGVTTDNIILDFTNVATLGGTINGQVRIGESSASELASAVPEPASAAMLGLGLAGVGLFRFRQTRRKLKTDAIA